MRKVDIDSGTLEVVNHKNYDYASTALNLVNVTNTDFVNFLENYDRYEVHIFRVY